MDFFEHDREQNLWVFRRLGGRRNGSWQNSHNLVIILEILDGNETSRGEDRVFRGCLNFPQFPDPL
jgi:hypothetical protein